MPRDPLERRAAGRSLARVGALLVVAVGVSCHGEVPTLVEARLAGDRRLPSLPVVALPFDPDHVLDSLAALSPTPRPTFTALETELRAFRATDEQIWRDVSGPWRATRDTVARLADSLAAMRPSAPAYARAFERFRDLYARLAQRAGERDAAFRRRAGADLTLVLRAQAAAESLRAWEEAAYAAYPEAAARASLRSGRFPVDDTTDGDGRVRLALTPGRWWVDARHPHPENPFLEYAWNVPVTVTGWLPTTVPLTPRNAELRWRH